MSTSSSSLRPGWSKGNSGGRGFQPPPTVADRGEKGRSGSWGSQERGSANKFAALDDDDDGFIPVAVGKTDDKPSGTSRSEAFRSSFGRQSSTGSKPSGRSLADLAARVPEPPQVAAVARRTGAGTRFPGYRSTNEAGNGADLKPETKVIRYTREKLLSMRVVPKDNEIPDLLQEMIGSAVISETAQDPVCWDAFDSEEIWEAFRERRVASGAKAEPVAGGMRQEPTDPRRRPVPTGGRWQRGVALPPPEETSRKKNDNATNSDELWDDPGGATGAAADFSAFGAMPPDDGDFDFDKMAEATRKLDEELHGTPVAGDSDDIPSQGKMIDKARPLASAGMTIASGSGDHVNVFEDFDAPIAEKTTGAAVQGGSDQDPSASSRLMKMIGVEPPKTESYVEGGEVANPWGVGSVKPENGMDSLFGSIGLSLNPWGGAAPAPVEGGVGFSGRLEGLAAEQRAREQQLELEKRALRELELHRQQQEEAQRLAMAQRQAEEQARSAAMQQPSPQSQVELVLMERICSILEISWGRSDLSSILSTLHSEDSRVIPLLGNVDALRALIARSPQRIALRRDPSFAGDMAVLLITNSQWQQQQQQQAQARQQEELHRHQLQEAREAQSRHSIQIDPSRPWFYSDPQSNVQGPFRGEEMRQWLEAGYFKGDLPISQQPTGPFNLLSLLFPDLNYAFRSPPVSDDKAEKEAAERLALEKQRKQAEEERRAAERAEAERKAAAHAAEVQKASKKGDNGNESSTKLKIMLGLSGGQELVPENEPSSKQQTVEKKGAKLSNTLPQKAVDGEVFTALPPVPVKSAAAVWGGTSDSMPKKSIAEIQQEEARRAAIEAAQGGGVTRPSSGWANVAAGTQGWSSGVVKKASTQPAAAMAASVRPAQASRAKSQPSFPELIKPPSLSQQHRSSSSVAGSTAVEDFGASMSPALEIWCKEQMLKLSGSDDLTLIAFCMTLTDANEIRQYLQAYLGTGPKVSSFAAEFIVKRGLGKQQEEWETPGSAKKGRKKKVGGR